MKKSTLNKLLKLAELVDDEESNSNSESSSTFPFDGKVVIRTVTHYYTGLVAKCESGFVTLMDAAWIADTGRWSEFLQSGNANEVEPFTDDVAISLGAIVDITRWNHELPRTVK